MTPTGGSAEGPPRPTIRSVAKRAGVSKSLVSLVMRGAPNVSEERRAAVLEAARALGYRPNLLARSLGERRTRTLGVLLSDLHNPFFAEVIDGVHIGAEQHGLRLVMGTGRRVARLEAEVVESFLQQAVEGLILLGPALPDEDILAVARAAPTVVVAREVAGGDAGVVINDDLVGAELVVDHLVSLGHRRIAHVHGGAGGTAAQRRAGYEEAMERRGLAHEIVVVPGDSTDEGGYRGAGMLLAHPRRPTAVFAYNDLAAIGVLTAVSEAGLSVPEDISVVGYDNTYLAGIRHLSLTSVDQMRRDMGRLAVECVVAPGGVREVVRVVEPRLQIRRSSGAAPQPDRTPPSGLTQPAG